ncbi:Tubby-like F-box protein 7 [Dendrobium catenatum]|uniref:Tubby-like F-box protein 7 n=1 Tax=Dendrobium catenatum TaxID=906689 RepID=A0A2I0WZB5_9ASPA|nr:Tubby-like F-box protein 7 [Dendrobium catenatum]
MPLIIKAYKTSFYLKGSLLGYYLGWFHARGVEPSSLRCFLNPLNHLCSHAKYSPCQILVSISNLSHGSRRTQFDDVDNLLQLEATAAGSLAAIGSVEEEDEDEDRWSCMFSELLAEIIKRVEVSEDQCLICKSVDACACVCRKWS